MFCDLPQARSELVEQQRDDEGGEDWAAGQCLLEGRGEDLPRDAVLGIRGHPEGDREVAGNHICSILSLLPAPALPFRGKANAKQWEKMDNR